MTEVQIDSSGGSARFPEAPDLHEKDTVGRAFDLLGGSKVFKHRVRNALEAHDVIVSGLYSRSLIVLVEKVGVLSSGDVLSSAVGMSLRTLQRKKQSAKADDRLSPEQSSRTWRFAETLARATEVLGDQEAAEAWLMAPAMGLDNRRPIELLSSAAGAEAVHDHLTRMEYGVYT